MKLCELPVQPLSRSLPDGPTVRTTWSGPPSGLPWQVSGGSVVVVVVPPHAGSSVAVFTHASWMTSLSFLGFADVAVPISLILILAFFFVGVIV